MDMADILDSGDCARLSEALKNDPGIADRPVVAGSHSAHPVHAICDRVFDGRLAETDALAMVSVLLKAGANIHHVHAANGDGLLTSAISLSCPGIALALLAAGAPVDAKGLFGARPVHWSAIMGMPAVLEHLLAAGVDIHEADSEFASTPLGWAMEGWASPPKGSHGHQTECTRLLVSAGAIVEPQWARSERVRADAALSRALGLG